MPAEPKRAATISDVASRAGVSVKTVSRFINDNDYVSHHARQRISEAIEELGYRPNRAAQNLASSRPKAFGNITLVYPPRQPDNVPYSPLELDFIVGAAAATGRHEFFFNLITTNTTEQHLLELYQSGEVDGTILMEVQLDDPRVAVLKKHAYPFVMIGRCGDNQELSFVDLDFEGAVECAFEHLLALGHRTIGFINPPAEMRSKGYGPAVRALETYYALAQRHDIKTACREVSYVGQDVFNATIDLLDELPDLTAIVSVHTYAALNIVPALHSKSLSVPGDVSLVSLATQRIADLSSPALTHIDFPSHDMGFKAVEFLIRLLAGERADALQLLVPPKLVVRDSTAQPVRR